VKQAVTLSYNELPKVEAICADIRAALEALPNVDAKTRPCQ
jgi:hypothetical protein